MLHRATMADANAIARAILAKVDVDLYSVTKTELKAACLGVGAPVKSTDNMTAMAASLRAHLRSGGSEVDSLATIATLVSRTLHVAPHTDAGAGAGRHSLVAAIERSWTHLHGTHWKSHEVLVELAEVAEFARCIVDFAHCPIKSIVADLSPGETNPAKVAAAITIITALYAPALLTRPQLKSHTYGALMSKINGALMAEDEPIDKAPVKMYVAIVHLIGTTGCKPNSPEHGEPRPRQANWDDYYAETALNGKKWPSLCVFIHRHTNITTGHTTDARCDHAPRVGAHIKARQRFWIVPSCDPCNRQHGSKMWVECEELVCQLPRGCLHEFKNGEGAVESATAYAGHHH